MYAGNVICFFLLLCLLIMAVNTVFVVETPVDLWLYNWYKDQISWLTSQKAVRLLEQKQMQLK